MKRLNIRLGETMPPKAFSKYIDNDGWVTWDVYGIDLYDLVGAFQHDCSDAGDGAGISGLNNMLVDQITDGSYMIGDISYEIVGWDKKNLLTIRVKGNANEMKES